MVHTSFVLVVLHCFQHLERILDRCNSLVPSPSSRSSTQESQVTLWGAKPSPAPLLHPKLPKSGRDTSQRQVTDWQAPKEPLSSNAASYPAPFPGCALSLEPQIQP